jgi:molybdenum cofactor cytidylyltransferase
MQGLLLAAGRSSRFGADKLLHPLADGTPMALAAARNLSLALPSVLVVVNGAATQLMALLQREGLPVTVCPHAETGMGASLAWGVAQSQGADGWLIALADMPWIQPATLQAVAQAVTGPDLIAAPLHQGQRGHPVAFGRAYQQALLDLAGDQGARQVVAAHASNLVLLPCADAGVVRDVDLREQV